MLLISLRTVTYVFGCNLDSAHARAKNTLAAVNIYAAAVKHFVRSGTRGTSFFLYREKDISHITVYIPITGLKRTERKRKNILSHMFYPRTS